MNTPLNQMIALYVAKGYRVLSQTEDTAQLVKPKHFSLFWALAWLLCFGIGILIYVFWYASRSDQTVYLTTLPNGAIMADSNKRSGLLKSADPKAGTFDGKRLAVYGLVLTAMVIAMLVCAIAQA